jgi:hypothetical protein
MLWKDKNVRVVGIWNKVIFRQPTETFHEFLIEVPLKWSFGEQWHKGRHPDAPCAGVPQIRAARCLDSGLDPEDHKADKTHD